MAFNSIAAKLELARIFEEASAKGKSLDLSEKTHTRTQTKTSTKATRVETAFIDDEHTEVTAVIGKPIKREANANNNPYFDIEKIRQTPSAPVNVGSLLKSYKDPQGRRSSPRYKIRLRVVLYTANQSFRTVTSDLSLNGALLQEPLPEAFANESFDVLFIVTEKRTRTKEYFIMRGKVIDGSKTRVCFESSTAFGRAALEALMENLSQSASATAVA